MAFSHWFEQLCAGDLPFIFDLNCYWNYHSNLLNSFLINQPFAAAITLRKINVLVPIVFLDNFCIDRPEIGVI